MAFEKGYDFSIRTPNWIDPMTFEGVSLNQAMYVTFGVVFVLAILVYYAYFFLRNPNRPGLKIYILKPLAVLYVILFVGLSSVGLIIFCQNVWSDIRNFSELTLDQKREKLLLNHYYPFLQFCKQHIPENAKLGFAVHDTYYDIYARYFLFPRYDHAPGPDKYIIVFHPEKLPAGEPFAIFGPAEYILLEKGEAVPEKTT